MEMSIILEKCSLSRHSSSYSGRGATLSDLNGQILTNIHNVIKVQHGLPAAAAFVDMVESMEEMNATDFIENCFLLERSGYNWKMENVRKIGFNIPKDGDGRHNFGVLVGTAMAMMNRDKRDDTAEIRNDFLRKNGKFVQSTYDNYKFGTRL